MRLPLPLFLCSRRFLDTNLHTTNRVLLTLLIFDKRLNKFLEALRKFLRRTASFTFPHSPFLTQSHSCAPPLAPAGERDQKRQQGERIPTRT